MAGSRGVTVRAYASGAEAIQIQFHYRGVQCRETLKDLPATKANLQYAAGLRAEILRKITLGTFNYADYFPESKRARLFGHHISRMTVQEAQSALIDDLARAGRERTTIQAYKRSAERINEYLGSIKLVDLEPEHIRQMVRDREVSRKTWNNDLLPLRRALKRAVNDNVIPGSPLERVELDELVPRTPKVGPDPFSLAEIQSIRSLTYCPRFGAMFSFAVSTGVRIEELVALQWDDVDDNRLRVCRAAQLSLRSSVAKSVKTPASDRVVDLRPWALDALRRQRTVSGWRGEFIWGRWNCLKPITDYEQINRRWRTMLRKSKVRYRPFKQTRHTYASHMLSSGENPRYVAAQMGHKDTSMLDVYGRWVDEWKGNNVVRFGT